MGPQTPLNGNPDPVDPPNQILKVALSIGDYFRIVSYFCDAVWWGGNKSFPFNLHRFRSIFDFPTNLVSLQIYLLCQHTPAVYIIHT